MILLPLHYRIAWAAGGLLLALVLAFGSLLPGPVVAAVSFWDKGEHFLGYFALAAWWLGLLPRNRYLACVIAVIAFGIGIELAQGFLTTTRQMDPTDVLANSLGAGLAWLAATLGLGRWAVAIEAWLSGRPPGGPASR
ncbi:MAG: VanZ family protein [Gammaproteobacteria bacterium]|nr:VanZ family protein [Gammaproteobacteria bacterium]